MSFFETSTGEAIAETNSFENSGIQPVIPEGTQLHANILEATWEAATAFNKDHILLTWYITEPGKYTGFLIKHKLAVFDDKASKADKAKTMLMAIDSNCKGLLAKADKAGKLTIGDNAQLARALCGGSALLTLAVYDMPSNTGGDNITGNWVRAVAPVAKKQAAEDKAINKQAERQPGADDDIDDEIPF